MSTSGLPAEIGTVVIGGGITGLCLGWFLAEEGEDVAVIDDGRHSGSIANAGSLHVQMQSRLIQLDPDMAAAVETALPLYVQAVRQWEWLAQAVNRPIGLAVTGGLMVAESGDQLDFLTAKCAREAALGLDVRMLDREELHGIAPYLGPALIGAELCGNEGKVNPLLANMAVRDMAVGAGALCVTGRPVTSIEPAGPGYRLGLAVSGLTAGAGGGLTAGRVVIAAGAGSARLAAGLGIALPVAAEPLHMNITEAAAPLVGHLVQHAERMITLKQLGSGHMVIGGGWPATGRGTDRPPSVRLDSLLGNVGLAARLVPGLGALDIIRCWAGINPTADGLAILGPLPGYKDLHLAIGGDAGYTLAPLVARLVAATALGRTPEFDIGRYSVERFRKAG